MKKIMLTALCLAPLAAWAAPSSQVAWTPETLNQVKSGNAEKGKTLAVNCTACHGDNGVSVLAGTPSLAGQLPTYLFKQLIDYRNDSRHRHETMMSAIAKTVSEQDVVDVAAWFAAQTPAKQPADGSLFKKAEKLVSHGDNQRLIAPCEVCHGGDGKGQKMDVPALAGQRADYLEATLQAFKQDERHNDIYSRMRSIAKQLSDEEIKELAAYYQGMK